jgi:hypothetical protein
VDDSELSECNTGDRVTDPRTQFAWEFEAVLEVDGYPHRACVSIHYIPNFNGLLRIEMIIATGMLLDRVKWQETFEQDAFPVCAIGEISSYNSMLTTYLGTRLNQPYHYDLVLIDKQIYSF